MRKRDPLQLPFDAGAAAARCSMPDAAGLPAPDPQRKRRARHLSRAHQPFRRRASGAGRAARAVAARRPRQPIRICPRRPSRGRAGGRRRVGARPLFTIEPAIPPALAAIEAPPPLLYVKGDAGCWRGRWWPSSAPATARPPARSSPACSPPTSARAGFVIASGLARGIDAAAHEAALASGTVAVLAGGIDNIYPPEHADTAARASASAAAWSPRTRQASCRAAQDFPRRNRIISGLSLGVLIVEAARRSGTLITARMAGRAGPRGVRGAGPSARSAGRGHQRPHQDGRNAGRRSRRTSWTRWRRSRAWAISHLRGAVHRRRQPATRNRPRC